MTHDQPGRVTVEATVVEPLPSTDTEIWTMGKRKFNKATKTEPKTKRQRPDRAQRLSLRQSIENFVITASFGGRLLRDCPRAVKAYIQETIDDYVLAISQMAVRGSLVFNEVLFRYFDDGLGMPPIGDTSFFRQCFTGIGKHQTVTDILQTVFQECPAIPRYVGDWAPISYAVNHYQTSFRTSIFYNFDRRLGKLVSSWVDKVCPNAPDGVVGALIRGILGHDENENDSNPIHLSEEMNAFVAAMRERFGHPDNVDSSEIDFDTLVRYSYIILNCHREYGLPGGFSLAPLCSMRRHHISIDSTTLYCILRKTANYFQETAPEWIRMIASLTQTEFLQADEATPYTYRQYAWMRFFDTFSLSGRDFTGTLLTDGVKTSVVFERPKKASATREEVDLRDRFMVDSVERIIAIDPGRTNLVTSLEVNGEGKEIFRTLTKRSYYNSFSHAVETLKKWNARLRDVDEEFSLYSPRTSFSILREGYIGVYFQQYDRIWHERGSKRHARMRFYISSKKRSALDKFFRSFVSHGQPEPVVLYGAARLRSHGTRGELSVPVKRVLTVCRRFFYTVMVDEFRTSKRHSKCHLDMHPVRTRAAHANETRGERRRRTVRGLYYCGKCKKFVDRDRDACRSIMDAGLSEFRPAYLSRSGLAVWKRPVDKLPVSRRSSS
jgi:hypothetical protein